MVLTSYMLAIRQLHFLLAKKKKQYKCAIKICELYEHITAECKIGVAAL